MATNIRTFEQVAQHPIRGKAWLPYQALIVHSFALAAALALSIDAGAPLLRPVLAFAGIVTLTVLIAPRGTHPAELVERVPRRRAHDLTRLVLPVAAGGMAVGMLTTGAPDSPLLPLGVSLAWTVGLGSRREVPVYVATFATVYVVAGLLLGVGPGEGGSDVMIETTKTLGLVWLAAALAGRGVGLGRGSAPVDEPRAADQARWARIRPRLTRVLGNEPVPLDGLMLGTRAGLTLRETEMLSYLVVGLTNQEIADALCIAEATVKYRLTRLYRRLGVARRREAIEVGRELGLHRVEWSRDA